VFLRTCIDDINKPGSAYTKATIVGKKGHQAVVRRGGRGEQKGHQAHNPPGPRLSLLRQPPPLQARHLERRARPRRTRWRLARVHPRHPLPPTPDQRRIRHDQHQLRRPRQQDPIRHRQGAVDSSANAQHSSTIVQPQLSHRLYASLIHRSSTAIHRSGAQPQLCHRSTQPHYRTATSATALPSLNTALLSLNTALPSPSHRSASARFSPGRSCHRAAPRRLGRAEPRAA